jgi:hypothetical protein
MTTNRIDPHTPMDPRYIIKFLSKSQLDQSSVKCMIKALKEYHKKCAAAAKELDEELKECFKPAVQVRRPPSKK